jgi:glycosyltransferase involved in cell wall biosynthesis
MVTYNHEAYISQSIDSVLSQSGELELEIVVGEDCSTDRTREIVSAYARRYPAVVRPLFRDANVGGAINFRDTFDECRGKYLAILDGDDYFSDPGKLVSQVGLMESSPGMAMSYHPVEVKGEANATGDGRTTQRHHRREGRHPPEGHRPIGSIDELLARRHLEFQACAVVLNRDMIGCFPEWITKAPQGDWPLFVQMASLGSIGFINRTMAVYRMHGGGTWSAIDQVRRVERAIEANRIISDHIPDRYRSLMDRRISWNYAELSIALSARGDRTTAREYIRKCLALNPTIAITEPKLTARMMAFAYAPGVAERKSRTTKAAR